MITNKRPVAKDHSEANKAGSSRIEVAVQGKEGDNNANSSQMQVKLNKNKANCSQSLTLGVTRQIKLLILALAFH